MESVSNVEREVGNFLDKLAKFESAEGNEIEHMISNIREAKEMIEQRKEHYY